MVMGNLPVPGRPTNLDCSRARAHCGCSRCGWGCWAFFLSSIISLFFHPLSGRRLDMDLNTVSKGREAQNDQPTSEGAGVGWLFVLGLTALWDNISVYIGPSPKEREKEKRKDR